MTTLWKSLAVLALVALTGCASGVKRTNYQRAQNFDPSQQCRVAIKFRAHYDPERVEVLGAMKAYDTGFAVKCSEAYVLSLLCEDACALGADLINILEEKQPDNRSSCFRVKAEFIRFKDRTKVKKLYSDVSYTAEYIIQRSQESTEAANERLRRAIISGAVGGAVGGAMSSGR